MEDLFWVHRESLNPSNCPLELFAHYSIPAFDEERVPKVEPGSSIRSGKLMVQEGSVLLSKAEPTNIARLATPSGLNSQADLFHGVPCCHGAATHFRCVPV